MGQRLAGLKCWVEQTFTELNIELAEDWQCVPVSGDASFRRYFRLLSHGMSWILMDAPPEKENSHPFVCIAKAWEPLEIHAPVVHAVDLEQGYMLLSDLGDDLYLDKLTETNADELYGRAFSALTRLQQCQDIAGHPLPHYDRALLQREMDLFRDWLIGDLLKIELKPGVMHLFTEVSEFLIGSALEQPAVCVHRDYHSRNLLVDGDDTPGVIDFQDAVIGPVTYDLVSLLRDCYIEWPDMQVYGWVDQFGEMLVEDGLLQHYDRADFYRWFDLMGAQRHLKAAGIFARLNLRDGKPGYLEDIPRTLNYIIRVAGRYDSLLTFAAWLQDVVVPAMYASEHFENQHLDRWFS
ncbi:aminoglycoside phosphotransferase family protein [Amphritea balenae]|uniref:Aminoglycoside phosphotransferase n=1 Tax=Amphritea balenae TaxID=452629 RepID=A0A3P1SPG4_9GAMM|nr:phosphotransferase [Amphritea balenae]RRC99161.1 aminoglycoside phosphotransferase [Amphritea balenae]GGK73416.1 phosphotransferase [Amphritea balenae]